MRTLAISAFVAVLACQTHAISVTTTSDANTLLNAGLGSLAPGITITGVSYSGAGNASGTYTNLSFSPLASLSSGLLMTTGDAQTAVGPNNDDSAGSDNGGPSALFSNYDGVNSETLYNVATLTVNFTAANSTNLAFDFSFGSDEYYYYTNSPFNDAFFAFLDSGTTSLALDPLGHAITVDNQYLTIDNRPSSFSPTNGYGLPDKAGIGGPVGTSELQYDGFTPVLRTSFSVAPGAHSLSFVIGDAGDSVLDSGVFISHAFQPSGSGGGTKPATPGPAAAVAFGLALIARRRRR